MVVAEIIMMQAKPQTAGIFLVQAGMDLERI
jgi:hypothetical protein